MPEKKFKTVLEIGGSVGSSLKNSFNVLTGNTKKLGATIKGLNKQATTLRGELKSGLGGAIAQRELAKLEAQIKRTRAAADALGRIRVADFGGKIQQLGSSMARRAAVLTGAVTGVVAGGYAMVNSSAGYADMAKKSADALRMQANALIEMKHAADLSGISGEQLEASFSKLLITMEKGRNIGTKENTFLNAMGLNPEKLSALRDNEKKIRAFMEAYSKYNGAYKTQIAKLMAGDPKMLNFLNLSKKEMEEASKEAKELGLTVTEEQIRNSVLFKDQQTRIGAAIKGVGNIISLELLEPFNEMSERFLKFVKGKHGDIKKWAEDFGKYIKTNAPIWIDKTKKFASQLEQLGKSTWKVIQPLGGVKFAIGALVALPFGNGTGYQRKWNILRG
jgi:hypothetical protein